MAIVINTTSPEVSAKFRFIAASLYTSEAQRAFEAGGRGLASVIRARAPKDTGRLRRSIVISKPSPRLIAEKGPAVFVLSKISKRKSSNYAPHSHLVEGGTKHMQGQHFFREGVQAGGEVALERASRRMQEIIEGAASR